MKNLVAEAQKIRFRVDNKLNNRDWPKLSAEKTAAVHEMAKNIKLPDLPKKTSK